MHVVVEAGLLHTGDGESLFQGDLTRFETAGGVYELFAVLLRRAAELYAALLCRLYAICLQGALFACPFVAKI